MPDDSTRAASRLPVFVAGSARRGMPYSPALISGDFVFVSGQASEDPVTHEVIGTNVVEQTKGTFRNVEALLRAAGCTLSDVVKVNAYLADINDFDAFSETYMSFFQEPRPARTTVGVALTGILVEIDCIARIPTKCEE